MEILSFPHPALFTKCKPVTVFGPELLVLLERMWETMVKANGLGLSSNQVSLDYNMFTMLGPNDEKLFIVNPKIVDRSPLHVCLQEGCLSAKDQIFVLKRSRWVDVSYQDENGEFHERRFERIHSVCFQHELEHLNGQSFFNPKVCFQKNTRKMGE